jgi:hypothetical protein
MVEQGSRRWPVRTWLPLALLVLSFGLIVVFGLRTLREYRRLQAELTPGTVDVEQIRGWMTLPYIARGYDVPQAALFSALGVPESGNARLSIRQLAGKYQRDPSEIRATIQHVILEWQRSRTAQPAGTP